MAVIEKSDHVQVATGVENRATKRDIDSENDSQRSDDEVLSTLSGGNLVEGYISYLPVIQFGFNLLATWDRVGLTLQLNLLNGGNSALIYDSLLSGVESCLVGPLEWLGGVCHVVFWLASMAVLGGAASCPTEAS
ncbi:hypothetical protein PG997_011965 [Apiospora hydei]|uniref:Uncharacterized protein n=1 Tax=Apiospora hydei TaxID=1337664 RepID=A0ABR1V208_9PEZI